MIKVNFVLKNNDLEEILKSEIKSFFSNNSQKVFFQESLSTGDCNANDIRVIFFELENSGDIKKSKELRDSIQPSCIIFLSKEESLVFESLGANPLQFIRLNNFDEDLNKMFETLLEYINNRDTIITLKSGTTTLRLNVNNIIFIESLGHYLTVHSTTGEYRVRGKLLDIIEKVNNPILIRAHKSYIINDSFIEKVSQNRLTLKNKFEVPIGRAFKEEVMKVMIK